MTQWEVDPVAIRPGTPVRQSLYHNAHRRAVNARGTSVTGVRIATSCRTLRNQVAARPDWRRVRGCARATVAAGQRLANRETAITIPTPIASMPHGSDS